MAKKILVIDDDEDILAILNIIFGEEGYELVLMNTGATTEQIKILYPNLILLDVRIAGYTRSGDQICADLKNQIELSVIPVVLLSAEQNLSELAKSCGANAYITKPFDIQRLLAKVKEFIN